MSDSGTNGRPSNGRDRTGKFAPGNKIAKGGVPGWNKLPSLIRREIVRRGGRVRDVAWEAFETLQRIMRDDGEDSKVRATAAKAVLDRTIGPVKEPPTINVGVGVQVASAPRPNDVDLSVYLERLNAIAKEQGIVDGGE